MKLLKITKYNSSFLVLVIFLSVVGCTESFSPYNKAPDEISESDIDKNLVGQAFAQAQWYGMLQDRRAFQRANSLYSDVYAQYFSITHQSFHSGQFSEIGAWTNLVFDHFYSNPATQLNFVEVFTQENNMPLENAIAKIWRVEMYHRMTDFHGPIIYSEFGNQQTSVPYDSQESIYEDFFVVLDDAIEVLEDFSGQSVFSQHDQIYDGDVDNWIIFANSLRLRLAMRLAYVNSSLAEQEAEKAVSAGVMVSNSQNAEVLTTQNSINGYPAITYNDEFRMSTAMQSVMVGFDDPRTEGFFEEAVDGGGYKGMRNGVPPTQKGSQINDLYSFIDTKWRPLNIGGTNPPIRVMSASEVYFLRAEGALRNWSMGGTPKELYEEGIRLSLEERTDATAQDITDYINSTNTPMAPNGEWNSSAMSDITVVYNEAGSFEKQLEQIITQKWIALFPDGLEAWAERRRTGYPIGYEIIESLHPDISENEMMRRLKFTPGEISNNTSAVEAALDLLNGPDENYTRLWWDAKPLSQYPSPAN